MRKHYSFKKASVLLAACMLSSSLLLAIPARKGIQTITQPDGKKIALILQGDENFHYQTTTDEYVVVKNESGYYVFAQVSPDGRFIPSTIKACDPQERDASISEALKQLMTNKNDLSRALVKSSVSLKTKKEVSSVTKATGSHGKCVIILAQFSDKSYIIPNAKQEFSDMMNKAGYTNKYGQRGSALDFFKDNSMGQFSPEFTVIGPVTLPNTMSYYGANNSYGDDIRPAQMVVDAINKAKTELEKLNLSDYDNDGDGNMDNIFIYYSGNNEAEGGPANSVWPHAWNIQSAGLSAPVINGIKINTYACSSELSGSSNNMAGIGTFVHEFGHILGLPDMYDSDYNGSGGNSFALDCWSTMSGGSYNGDGYVPAGYTAYERMFCGWLTPKELAEPQIGELRSLQNNNEAYIIKSEKDNEYFLLENRQLEKWDRELPKSGMLIYHIDYNPAIWKSNSVNVNPDHQYVDLKVADNSKVIYTGNNLSSYLSSLEGDTYPGSTNKTEFTDNSKPGSLLWNGAKLNKPITNIKENNNIITFSFMGGSDLMAPKNLVLSDVKDSEFSISWDAVDKAEKYFIDVFTYEGTTEEKLTETFGFSNPLIPEGFTTTISGTYTSSGNFGQASPSLKMDRTGAYIETRTFTQPITALSFWLKGQGLSGSKLKVEGFDGTNWNIIDEFIPTNNGTTKSYSANQIPANTVALKFSYTKSSGNLAFDDLAVSTSSSVPAKVYVDGYNHKEVGNVLSTKVSGLSAGKEYSVQLKSGKGDVISALSNELKVTTSPSVGIDKIEETVKIYSTGDNSIVIDNKGVDVQADIFNISGTLIKSEKIRTGKYLFHPGQKGIYIVRCGTYSAKVVL